MEDREHRKKRTNDERWVAMEFLKNFNNER